MTPLSPLSSPARTDANQREIVAALRKIGATVTHLNTVGRGCPDLLVGYDGRNYLMEVKTIGGTCTADETKWINEWEGQVEIVRSAEQAIELLRWTP